MLLRRYSIDPWQLMRQADGDVAQSDACSKDIWTIALAEREKDTNAEGLAHA